MKIFVLWQTMKVETYIIRSALETRTELVVISFLESFERNLNSILEYLFILSRSIQGYPIDRICIM